jgi:hypothetical protein
MRLKHAAALAAALFCASAPALADDPVIAPGHVLGNGTSAARTATDATIGSVLTQAGLYPGSMATLETYGASTAASDNTTAVTAALNSGQPLYVDGLYKVASAITVTACPSITGGDPSKTGFLFTGSGNGFTFNCNQTITQPNTGKINLQGFGIYTNYTGAGTPLKLNFAAQAPANVPIVSADVRNIHVSGQVLTSQYWTGPVTCINCYGSNWYFNWISGKQSDESGLMSAGLYFTNSGASVPSMGNTIYGNQIYGVGKAISLYSQGGYPALEGYTIRDNNLVTNQYAIYIDESANSYYSPGFVIDGNATNDLNSCIYLKKISQVFIDGNYCYVNGASSDGMYFNNVNTIAIGTTNQWLDFGGLSSGYAVHAVGTGAGQIYGGFMQNFAVGVYLDASSSQWIVSPINFNTVTTSSTNLGASNIFEQYFVGTNTLSLTSNLSAFSYSASSWYNSAANNDGTLPTGSLTSAFSLGWNYAGSAEMDLFNTYDSPSLSGFNFYQMTGAASGQLLGSFLYTTGGGVLQLTPVTIAHLPACSAAGSVGEVAFISNGVASPTYHQAVSSTGSASWLVTCAYTGSFYGWVY